MIKKIWDKFANKYFGEHLDFRVRVFNVTLVFGIILGLAVPPLLILFAHGEDSPAGRPGLISPILSAFLLWYANKSGKFQLCFWIQTIISRMLISAIGFFLNGGYSNGMLLYFVHNLLFTATIFRGRNAIIVPLILFIEYTALCMYAYYNPDSIRPIGEFRGFLSNITAFVTVCISIGAILYMYIKLQNKQTRQLEVAHQTELQARQTIIDYEKKKSDFYVEMNHDIRTPLSVIALHADIANDHIGADRVSSRTQDYLTAINQEATRLAGIASLTLTAIKTPFEEAVAGGEVKVAWEEGAPLEPVYISDLVRLVSGVTAPIINQKGFTLVNEATAKLPPIRGNHDALVCLMYNLLQNALFHSGGKTITVRAVLKDGNIILTVADDGAGVSPSLLPTVFERGVSGKGSTGLGLHVCRRIVKTHGGKITMENRPDGGARVTMSFPVMGEEDDTQAADEKCDPPINDTSNES